MLKEARLKRGLSQSQLAKRSNIPLQTIQKYESGYANINHAKLETLLKICIVCECDIKEIISEEHLITLIKIYEEER